MSAWWCPDVNLGGSTMATECSFHFFLLSSLPMHVKPPIPLQNLQPFSLLPYSPHLEETRKKRGGA